MAADARPFLEPVAQMMPTEQQLQAIAEQTVLKIDRALKTGDFDALYDSLSDRWKYRGADPRRGSLAKFDMENREGRITVTVLKQKLQPFLDLKVDLSTVKGKKILQQPPAFITSGGTLVLCGVFDGYVFLGTEPPAPRKLKFQFHYVKEANSWRLNTYGMELVE